MRTLRGLPLFLQVINRASEGHTCNGHRLAGHPRRQQGLAWRLPSRSLQLAALRSNDADQHTMPLRGLLVDAAGTLIQPSEDVADVYFRHGQEYGCKLSREQILHNFRRAFAQPWTHSLCRYVGDGRQFWNYLVVESTGCSDPALLEQLYQYYARPAAWTLAADAAAALADISAAGMKLAVVSNFDTRLRPLLDDMGISSLFDSIIISAEVGMEKPNPLIFERACQELGVDPREAVHVGDDRRNDITGARSAGCHAWLWGSDVHSFREVESDIAAFNHAVHADQAPSGGSALQNSILRM